jgi:hypothetical protein
MIMLEQNSLVIPERAQREPEIAIPPMTSGFRVHACGVPRNDE